MTKKILHVLLCKGSCLIDMNAIINMLPRALHDDDDDDDVLILKK